MTPLFGFQHWMLIGVASQMPSVPSSLRPCCSPNDALITHHCTRFGDPSDNLSAFVADEGHDHGVQVEEEHEQVESELDEALLLVHIQLAEDFRGIKKMLVLDDPGSHVSMNTELGTNRLPFALPPYSGHHPRIL